jgi:hypothetical protein
MAIGHAYSIRLYMQDEMLMLMLCYKNMNLRVGNRVNTPSTCWHCAKDPFHP